MYQKKINLKTQQKQSLPDDFFNIIYSEKMIGLIAQVVEDKIEKILQKRVQHYCEKFMNKQIKTQTYQAFKNAQEMNKNFRKDNLFLPKRTQTMNTTQKSCKRCGSVSKNKAKKIIMKEFYKDEPENNLARVKSENYEILPVCFQDRKKSLKKESAEKVKYRSNSSKSNILILSPNNSQNLKISLSLLNSQGHQEQKTNQKIKKVLKKLNSEEMNDFDAVVKIVKENMDLKTKDIVEKVKKQKKDASVRESDSYMLETDKINAEINDSYRFYRTTVSPKTIQQYQNMSLVEEKRPKITQDKTRVLNKMVQAFPFANKPNIVKFIERNQGLNETELIQKWIAENEEDFEYLK